MERQSDLDLRLIEIFAAVVEAGTTPAAAASLGMSQSAVWNALRKFEAQLGLDLFRRDGRRLVPTPEGLQVHRDIGPVLGALDGLRGRLADLGQVGPHQLTIAAMSSLGRAVVAPALQHFLEDRPEISVNLELGTSDQVMRAVEFGLADLGLVLGAVPEGPLDATLLGRPELVAIMARDNLLTSRAVVGPADLIRNPIIGGGPILGQPVQHAFALQGVAYAPQLTCNREDGICAMVHAGLGVAVVDPYSAVMSRGLAIATRRFAPVTVIPVMAVQLGRNALAQAFLPDLEAVIESLAPAGWG